jgi:hypothetical protein
VSRKKSGSKGPLLSDREQGDIKLWFGWGSILGYPTGPRDYLREALKSAHRAEFLAMARPKRKAILRFVIAEHARRRLPPLPY